MVFDHLFRDVKTKTRSALVLLRREIGIKDLAHLRRIDSRSFVFDPDIHVEIFARAFDRHRGLFLHRSLNGVNDDVLDRAINLNGVTHQQAFFVTNGGV